jgi:2-(1,2-epoxy-1,2-dihydrophenyl)acetyl-CoA isomerase
VSEHVTTALDDGGIFTITINRPDVSNAISQHTGRQLAQACRDAELDPSVRVVIVTGAGKNFCAGGDIKSTGAPDENDPIAVKWSKDPVWLEPESRLTQISRGGEGPYLLHTMGKPTIAMMRGWAVGAGVGLAASCDFRVASDTTRFASGYARIGLSPDFGASYFVTRILGPVKAREYFFFNTEYSAEQAAALSLVTKVVPDADLEEETLRMARTLAQTAPLGLHYTKKDLLAAETAQLREFLEFEARNMARTFQTQDVKEAVAAFREKRLPRFTGR